MGESGEQRGGGAEEMGTKKNLFAVKFLTPIRAQRVAPVPVTRYPMPHAQFPLSPYSFLQELTSNLR